MSIESYENLIVWQKSIDLVALIYKLTEEFPKEEVYGLTSQISRRSSRKDFRNFILNAYGSGAELETQIKIAKRLQFNKKENYESAENLLSGVMRMLNKLCNSLKN